MRVFCPEHRRGFFTPRQAPIRCENKGHVIGMLDFEGEGHSPVEMRWQYCCNCEHFCPVDVDRKTIERCPVCTRESSLLFICDKCYTVSFEARTPLRDKNFTLNSEGVPQPACPGCLQTASPDLRDHTCEGRHQSFITALSSCPICLERLDVEPSFPCTVANYLRRTRTRNKLNVTFDYETEMFLPVDDGEFVIVSNGNEAAQPIVLPRSPRLASGRTFYEFYQDYYHCAQPEAGEIHIVRPATVKRAGDGWRPQVTGLLEVIRDQPKKKVPEKVVAPQPPPEPKVEPKPPLPPPEIKEKPAIIACGGCGEMVETRYAYCWQCGHPMSTKTRSSIKVNITPPDPANEQEEPTVEKSMRAAYSPSVSWSVTKEQKRGNSRNNSVKLIAIGVVGFLLVSLAMFAVTRSFLGMASTTAAVAPEVKSETKPAPDPVATAQPVAALVSGAQEESELKKLRDKRMAAKDADRPQVLKAFAKSEKQLPNDYRFPYERAKLAVKTSQANAYEDAFDALSVAAQKAIKTGKSAEMLAGLLADRSGDFRRLAYRHHEWTQLL